MEKFNLKWNDFQSNVSKAFGLFKNEKYLQDITLVTEDFKAIPAHKLVLSACSEYFRNILQQTHSGSQTLLCLDGVNAEDLKNVLDYVYEGEVKIHQEELDRFLNVAQRLKLEGLIGEENSDEDQVFQDSPQQTEDIAPTLNVVTKDIPKAKPTKLTKYEEKNIVAIPAGEMSEQEHKQRLYDNVMRNEDGSFSCKICGKTFKPPPSNPGAAKRNASVHVETHIKGLSYNCSHCDKTFRSSNSFITHKYRFH